MHVFILILSIAGQPEQIAGRCDTYKLCSDLGHDMQALYCKQFNRPPRDFSYRVMPAIIFKGKGVTT